MDGLCPHECWDSVFVLWQVHNGRLTKTSETGHSGRDTQGLQNTDEKQDVKTEK